MKAGDKFDVHGLTFTVRRVIARDRYIVEDANGELDAVEGPDEQGRFAVLIPTVRLQLAAHLNARCPEDALCMHEVNCHG